MADPTDAGAVPAADSTVAPLAASSGLTKTADAGDTAAPETMPISTGGWTIHGERSVYASDWLEVALVDIESPDGHRVREHHAIRMAQPAAGIVAYVDGKVLLMWRHRFIPRATSWEIPAGRHEPGETAIEAAPRECLEETGYAVGPLRPLVRWHPSPGISNQTFTAFLTTAATKVAEPVDVHEAERIVWLPLDEVRAAIDDGLVPDGFALVALLSLLRLVDNGLL